MSALLADSRRYFTLLLSVFTAFALVAALGGTVRAVADTEAAETGSVLLLTPQPGEEHIAGTVEIEISKIAQDTNAALAGAKLKVATADGKYTAEWVSGNAPEVLRVHPGSYVFTEVAAPAGYDRVAEVKFEVTADGRMTLAGTSEGVTVSDVTPEGGVVDHVADGTEYLGAAGPIKPGVYGEFSEGGTHSTLWVSRDTSFADKLLVYCFNMHKPAPDPYSVSKSGTFVKYVKRHGEPGVFKELAATPRDEGKVSEPVLKVLHNGMRLVDGQVQDVAGIKEKYKLTDAEWHHVTQEAVWYYTDSIPVADAKQNVRNAIHELVGDGTIDGAVTLQAPPAEMTLNLYKIADGTVEGKYQHLLGTEFVQKTPPPTVRNMLKVVDPKTQAPEEPKDEPTQPAEEPKDEPSQAPSEKPSDKPTPAAPTTQAPQKNATLPNTGASVVTWAGIGALLMAAGAFLVARRRA